MSFRAALLALAVVAAPIGAHAVEPDEILKDPALEARARTISSGLRCLVCQNQSIDDSQASLARDLRLIVRERLQAGDSDAAVRAYLTARYGDFVLLKPPFKPDTILLWGTPFVVLILGAAGLWARSRSGAPSAARPLTPEEQAKVDALIQEPGQ